MGFYSKQTKEKLIQQKAAYHFVYTIPNPYTFFIHYPPDCQQKVMISTFSYNILLAANLQPSLGLIPYVNRSHNRLALLRSNLAKIWGFSGKLLNHKLIKISSFISVRYRLTIDQQQKRTHQQKRILPQQTKRMVLTEYFIQQMSANLQTVQLK